MKILLFTVALQGTDYHGAGWIASFIENLKKRDDVSLGVCFTGSGSRSTVDGIEFFPIDVFNSNWNRLKRKFSPAKEEKLLLPEALRIVEEFRPDVIHIFGSENAFGLMTGFTDIPCVIHLQGILPAYYNAKFPPGTSKKDIFRKMLLRNPFSAFNFLRRDAMYRHSAVREIDVIKKGRYFTGRTAWDRGIVELLNPEAHYFDIWEVLRAGFYVDGGKWRNHGKRDVLQLVSVISPSTFKGGDLILKTAALLKKYADIQFQWQVFGVTSLGCDDTFLTAGKTAKELDVVPAGAVDADTLKKALLDSDIFIHPSYIDNSPNSVCEAQLLGLPVIATDVGGVSSLVQNEINGILVPANDPFMLASRILELVSDPEKASKLGAKSATDAALRHAPDSIIAQTIELYKSLITNSTAK